MNNMKRNKYNNMIKSRIENNVLVYLQSKRGSKCQEIEYTSLEMLTYLLPINSKPNIEEKRKIIKIANNFGREDEKCVWHHRNYCKSLNEKKPNIIYNELNGNLNNQIQILSKPQPQLNST